MFKKNNSGGWETSPIVCRWRCFKAYLVFRLPITLVAMALWFYLLGDADYTELRRVQSGFERTWQEAPDGARFIYSSALAVAVFVFAKAPARECMAAVALVTRPVRKIFATKDHGKGGLNSGFASLLEQFDTRYKKGDILLGASLYDPGMWLGHDDDRGLFCFGPAGSGKQRAGTIGVGATWPHTLICVDVKRQHVNVLYEQRLQFGPVHVLAPFGGLREGIKACGFDVMAYLDPASNAYFEDIAAIAEAIVMPTDKRNFFFDDSARQIIAGLISHIRTTYPEHANLVTVRKLLTSPRDTFKMELQKMQENDRDGGLARAAASRILRSDASNELNAVMATVDYNTQWITSRAMTQALSRSDFSIAEIKENPASLFLCMPVEELDKHGRFLRLFIYMVVRECAKKKAKIPILMIMDEFYSLGEM